MSSAGGSIFEVLQNILEAIGFGNDGDVLTSRGAGKFPNFSSPESVGIRGLGALARTTSDPIIANNIVTVLTLEDIVYDDLGFFNIATPTVFTIPAGVSIVQIFARIDYSGNDTGFRTVLIGKNGSTGVQGLGAQRVLAADAAQSTICCVNSAALKVVANDTFDYRAHQNSGAGLDLAIAHFGIIVLK